MIALEQRQRRWRGYREHLVAADFRLRSGRVRKVSSLVVEASGLDVFVGELCQVECPPAPGGWCRAEVVGLKEDAALLMPFGETRGIRLDGAVRGTHRSVSLKVGPQLLGRVIDPFGQPLDQRPAPTSDDERPLRGEPRNPLSRQHIDTPFLTGLRAIDTFLPMGKGQRVGIFAGSGVGKSTLLGMIARQAQGDVNVIALIGERGREVGEFLSKVLGPEGLARSVVVVATSDQPALVRELAAHAATTVAEYFSAQGKDVLLIMDSVTRFAMAHREIGLSIGEPPTARGYTPSSFAALPRLLERAGRFHGAGSITGIYTVLVEGDDLHEPVSDHMRAILDGHFVLSRDLANQGHYPALDVLKSVSRLSGDLWTEAEQTLVRRVVRWLAVRERQLDMIEIGAYKAGSNPELDVAVRLYPKLEQFLVQAPGESMRRADMYAQLEAIAAEGGLS